MRRSVLAHHAGSDDEDFWAVQLHVLRLALFQNHQVQCLRQSKVLVLAMSAVRLKIINLSENTAKASDKDWLSSQIPGAHLEGEHSENFLGAAERENGDEHAAIA